METVNAEVMADVLPTPVEATPEKKGYTLYELANNFTQITEQLEASGDEAGEDLAELHDIAKSLLEGKFDRVCLAKEALENYNEACEQQIERNNKFIKQIDNLIKQAVDLTPDKTISGLVFSAKYKKNPPAVNVVSESEVPLKYMNFKVSISDKFNGEEADKYKKYCNFILGREITEESPMTPEEKAIVQASMELAVDKKKASTDLKLKMEIPGLKLEQGESLKVDKAKNKLDSKKIKEVAAVQ